MNILFFAAWVSVQAILLLISVWFIVFGIRTWTKNRSVSLFVLVFGIGGIVSMINKILLIL